MMNWKTLAVATGALIILPLGSYAAQSHRETTNNNIQEQSNMRYFAQGMKHGKRGGGDRGMEKLLQQLDLTTEQSQQIETIREQSKTAAQDLHEQMQAQRQEMRALLASDEDVEQIRAEYQETQNLHQQLANNRFETMLQIREVLTSEQRAEIAELMEQHRGRRFRN